MADPTQSRSVQVCSLRFPEEVGRKASAFRTGLRDAIRGFFEDAQTQDSAAMSSLKRAGSGQFMAQSLKRTQHRLDSEKHFIGPGRWLWREIQVGENSNDAVV